ncbi:MAG: GAF domain-containing protein [Chloroflexi bacterium]|nr:GAF domain-containing protein [Chloroflexota bacterium]
MNHLPHHPAPSSPHGWVQTDESGVLDTSERELAALLSLLILITGLVGLFLSLVPGPVNPLTEPFIFVSFGTMASLMVAWLLNRLHRHTLGAWVTLIALTGAIFLLTWIDANPQTVDDYLIYLVIPILLSSILLRPFTVIVFSAGVLLVLFLLPIFLSSVDAVAWLFLWLYVALVAILLILAVFHQQRARNRNQIVLARREQNQRQLLAAAFDGVAIQERGHIVDATPGFIHLLGHDSLEKVRELQLIEPDDLAANVDGWQAPVEVATVREDGKVVHLEVLNRPYADGEQQGLILAVRDVTERIQAANALRQYNDAMLALHKANIRITSALTLEDVISAVIDATPLIFPQAMRSTVQIVDRQDNTMQTRYVSPDLADTGRVVFRPGYGLAGYAYLHRCIINVPDILQDDRFVAGKGPVEYRSMLVAPLLAGEGVWGTLSITARQIHAFDERDEAVADMLARQAAVMIDNVQLLHAEREQRQLAEAIRDSAASVNSVLALDDVLEQILVHIGQVVKHDGANIMLLDETGTVARVVRVHGYEDPNLAEYSKKLRFPLARHGNLRSVVESQEPMVIPDTDAFSGWVDMQYLRWIKSYATAPIRSKDRVIGLLNLDSKQPGFYTQADAETLRVFADQVGIAIENARLFEAERSQREVAETLRDIGLVLTRSIPSQEIFTQFLQQMARVIPYDAAGIWLVDTTGNARLAAGIGYDHLGVAEAVEQVEWHAQQNTPLRQMGQSRRIIVIPDAAGHNWFQDGFDWVGSWAGVPIWVQGRLYGQITLEHTVEGFYGQQHIPVLEALAGQLAIVLENANLLEQIQQHAESLEQRVTERTAQLDREQSRLRTILEAMEEGVMYTERSPSMDRSVIRYVNPALCRIIGYRPEELVGEETHAVRARLLSEEDLHRITRVASDRHWSADEDKVTWRGELTLHRKDRSSITAYTTISVIQIPATHLTWSVTVFRDISREKMLQLQKERFLANAAHELRTPLSNLVTRIYLLRMQPSKQDEHISVVEHTVTRLRSLAEDLLDITRYDSGMVEIHPEDVDLVTLVQEVLITQLALADLKSIHLVLEFPGREIIAEVDAGRFYQVVVNLVVNAIGFSHEGTQVQVFLHPDGEHVVLGVRDQGAGIADEHRDHIFEPFFRAGEGEVAGTGLGLSITREIVLLHGGDIWVESALGAGSCFYIRVPKVLARRGTDDTPPG